MEVREEGLEVQEETVHKRLKEEKDTSSSFLCSIGLSKHTFRSL